LRNNNIRLRSNPFVEITEWDINNETISFNFCFPIPQQTDFPSKTITEVFYDNPHVGVKDDSWKAEIYMELE